MLLSYSISDISEYALSFLYMGQNRELMWTHHVDHSYFSFPEQSFVQRYPKRGEVKREIKNMKKCHIEHHIETVLNGLIFHPRAHQHIESPINNHEIRVGGGIDNAFLYLFHLRYQLCPIQEIRDAERRRIVDLFEDAIRENRIISANELMPM